MDGDGYSADLYQQESLEQSLKEGIERWKRILQGTESWRSLLSQPKGKLIPAEGMQHPNEQAKPNQAIGHGLKTPIHWDEKVKNAGQDYEDHDCDE